MQRKSVVQQASESGGLPRGRVMGNTADQRAAQRHRRHRITSQCTGAEVDARGPGVCTSNSSMRIAPRGTRCASR